jgi:hypothetical protein
MTTPIDLQDRLEPFLDDYLIAAHQGTRLQMHQPERREVVFSLDQPWEDGLAAFFNLHRVGDKVRMYYRAFYPHEKTPEAKMLQTTGLAETTDGVHFTRPNLGLVEANGSTANNLVMKGVESHNFHVFMDDNPACLPDERFRNSTRWSHLMACIGARCRKTRRR